MQFVVILYYQNMREINYKFSYDVEVGLGIMGIIILQPSLLIFADIFCADLS